MKSSTQGLEEIWEDEVIAKGEREKKRRGVFKGMALAWVWVFLRNLLKLCIIQV